MTYNPFTFIIDGGCICNQCVKLDTVQYARTMHTLALKSHHYANCYFLISSFLVLPPPLSWLSKPDCGLDLLVCMLISASTALSQSLEHFFSWFTNTFLL